MFFEYKNVVKKRNCGKLKNIDLMEKNVYNNICIADIFYLHIYSDDNVRKEGDNKNNSKTHINNKNLKF